MIKPVSIDKGNQQHAALDFAFLRKQGIALLQQMAGKNWTDYNLHDPGVTILEQLCYAITDLAYRTNFPITDLLANEKGVIDFEKNSFFPREEILTTNPVTVNDYRKVLIDELEEVKNIWLYPLTSASARGALNGLYKMVVQVSRDVAEGLLDGTITEQDIIRRVKASFVSRRNLCEDCIDEVVILKPVKIAIEADLLVSSQPIPEEILAAVYHQLENSLNNPVRYFSEKEMLENGYTVDEIYSGPFLKNGFIPDNELNDRITLVDPTELIKTVSQVSGILSVKKLRIANVQSGKHSKPYKIDEFSFPLLDIQASEQLIKLYRDSFELAIKRPVFRSILQKIRESENRSFISSFYANPASTRPGGKYHNNERYHSIQEQFPKVYGIGHEGLLSTATDQRRAQAKQLKAYLLFFEQIMANYLSQLSGIADVFSVDLQKKGSNTYFTNPLYAVPGIKHLLKSFTDKYPEAGDADWELFKKDKNNTYLKQLNAMAETDATFLARKTRLYDHLFARFNEFVTTYPAELYGTLYTTTPPDERATAELKWKSALLKNIARLGANRVRAFDYLASADPERPDFEWKMRQLLHIDTESGNRKVTAALDPDTVITEPMEQPETAAEANKMETDDHSWSGDMPRILIDRATITHMQEKHQVERADDLPHDAFVFKKQDAGVLKHALDIRNFRIAPDTSYGSTGFIVLFKTPGDKKWQTISRFATHGTAMKSLKSLINYVRNINVQSEGFYIVEHILLRPDLNAPNFGFQFLAKDGQKLLEHNKWMTFKKRDEVIASLVKLFTEDEQLSVEKLAPFCRMTSYPPQATADENQGQGKNPLNYFKADVADRERFLSRFQMVIRGEDNSLINEDFFSLRMSVVFPSWPARFQDKNFREAAENLFRLNVPAQVNVNFIWMNVANLKRFEAIYFDWKTFMAENMASETRNELRTALIQLLYKYR